MCPLEDVDEVAVQIESFARHPTERGEGEVVQQHRHQLTHVVVGFLLGAHHKHHQEDEQRRGQTDQQFRRQLLVDFTVKERKYGKG